MNQIARKVGQLAVEKEISMGASSFAEVACYLALYKGNRDLAAKQAQQNGALPRVIEVLKSPILPGSTTGWGQPLAPMTQLADAFILSLRSASCFDAMLPLMKAVPLHQQVAVASGGASGAVQGEGQVIPIAKLTFNMNQVQELKTIAIVAVTTELLRLSNNKLFSKELTRAVAAATDIQFIAELTNGISPTTSNGGTAIAILQDLANALAGLTLDAASHVFLLVDSATAKHWSVATTQTGALLFPDMTPTGGVVQGMTCLVSDAISQQIVAVDAAQIVAAAGTIEIDPSDQTSIQFDSTPDSPPSASTNMVSLWQMNMTGIRAIRYWAAERLRTNAVSVVGSVNYGSANSPA